MPGIKEKKIICFYFDWILVHILNCVFPCRIRGGGLLYEWISASTNSEKLRSRCQLLLCVGWQGGLHPVDLLVKHGSLMTVNCGS